MLRDKIRSHERNFLVSLIVNSPHRMKNAQVSRATARVQFTLCGVDSNRDTLPTPEVNCCQAGGADA